MIPLRKTSFRPQYAGATGGGVFSPNPLLNGLTAGHQVLMCSLTGTGIPSSVSSFGGMVYSAATNKFVCQGGGHSATDQDPPSVIDMQNTSSFSFSALYQRMALVDIKQAYYDRPYGKFTAGSSTGPYPRAASRHTMHMSFCRGNDYIITAGIEGNSNSDGPTIASQFPAGWPAFPQSDHVLDGGTSCRYNLVTGLWTFDAPGNAISWWPGMSYDSVSDKAYGMSIAGQPPAGFWQYDPVTGTSTLLKDLINEYWYDSVTGLPINTSLVDYNISGVMIPATGKFYHFSRAGEVFEITINRSSAASSTIKRLTTTGTAMVSNNGNVDSRESVVNHVLDTTNNKILCGPMYGYMYAFDYTTYIWSRQYLGSDFHGLWAMADYTAVDNAFVYLDALSLNFYAFKWA